MIHVVSWGDVMQQPKNRSPTSSCGQCPLLSESGRCGYLGAQTDAKVRFRPKAVVNAKKVRHVALREKGLSEGACSLALGGQAVPNTGGPLAATLRGHGGVDEPGALLSGFYRHPGGGVAH